MFNCKKVNENEEITPSIKQSLHNFLHLTLTFFVLNTILHISGAFKFFCLIKTILI